MRCYVCNAPAQSPDGHRFQDCLGWCGEWGRVANDLNSAEQTGVALTAALCE